jgi:hypothetical protein
MTELFYYAYKRINHLNELLSKFQTDQTVNIPDEVFEMIKTEATNENIAIKDLTYEVVKRYFKKHTDKKYNRYYDYIIQIIDRLNDRTPLLMTPEMINNFNCLFLKIQAPFEKYNNSDRRGFFSYKFVLHKFCKIFGYEEFLPYFQLPNNPQKTYDNEQRWQKIMIDIGLND